MYKLWKIGTNVNFYIKELIELINKNKVEEFQIFLDKKNVNFKSTNGHTWQKNMSTASQFLRVLLSLGLIVSNNKIYHDSDVVKEHAKYNIFSKNTINIGDHISFFLQERSTKIFENNDLLYPSDESFIFSLLASIFYIDDKKNEKHINERVKSKKIKEVYKNYEDFCNSYIKQSPNYLNILESTKQYIVGFDDKFQQILNSINYKNYNRVVPIFSKSKIENNINSVPLNFGLFLKERLTETTNIKIPIYQRKYIWKKEIIITLLHDIKTTKNYHYLGNIVTQNNFNKKNSLDYKIVDGQQRITSLFIIARSLLDYSKFNGYEVDRMINEYFYLNLVSDSFKHIKGNDDFEDFKEIMNGRYESTNSKSKNSQISTNYLECLKWFDINMTSASDVNLFWGNLLNKLVFVEINAKDFNEYKLFEKLNTGSIKLTTLELFKNYILDKFHERKEITENEMQEIFENEIMSKFNNENRDKSIENFIITILRVKNSKISNDTLFNQWREYIETILMEDPTKTFKDILQEIGKEIDLYKNIIDYKIYSKKDSFTYGYSDFLYMLDGRTVYYPIIIKLINLTFENYQKPKIEEINKLRSYLKSLEIYEVRLQVTNYRGQSLSKRVENILEHIQNLSNNKELNPLKFWTLICSSKSKSLDIPTLNEFTHMLKTRQIANKPAKLIITRIENYFYLKNNWDYSKDTEFRATYDKPSQREHLLPIEWEANWKSFLENHTQMKGEDLKQKTNGYINFIGNCFPIPDWSNKELKNASFEKKVNHLKKEPFFNFMQTFYGIPNKLDKIETKFTHEEILKRSEQIANISEEIWKNFDD